MKRIIYYISTVLLLTAGYSCTTEVDEVFSESATERLEQSLTECRTLLLAAPNGWIIDYYPGEGQPLGGFNVLAKFSSNGDVVVGSELAGLNKTITSHFSFNTSNSVTLTFDTYNEILHYFSDPDIGKGTSYGGDFEFAYVKGTSSELVFKGTKTRNIIRFTALGEDQSWDEYLEGVYDTEKKVIKSPCSSFVWNRGGADEIEFEIDDNNNILTYTPDRNNPDVIESIGFCYSPTGIKLYEAIELGGASTYILLWDDAEDSFKSVDSSIALVGKTSEYYIPYDAFLGNWTFLYDKGKSSVNVAIVEDVYGSSFYLTGLPYNLSLGYSKKTGKLSLTTQYVGRYYSYYIYVCPWDTEAGRLTWIEGVGYDLVHNRDASKPVISFVDNGVWGNNSVSGLLFFAFTTQTASNTSIAGTLDKYPGVVSLHQ